MLISTEATREKGKHHFSFNNATDKYGLHHHLILASMAKDFIAIYIL